METLSVTDAQARLNDVMDTVTAAAGQPVCISDEKGHSVVLVSLAKLEAWTKTLNSTQDAS